MCICDYSSGTFGGGGLEVQVLKYSRESFDMLYKYNIPRVDTERKKKTNSLSLLLFYVLL